MDVIIEIFYFVIAWILVSVAALLLAGITLAIWVGMLSGGIYIYHFIVG